MMSCTVCREAKEPRAKVEVSLVSGSIWGSQVLGHVLLCKGWKRKKERDRERRETAKVGMRAKVGQSEKDGQTVKVGTLEAKVGSNRS